MKRFICALLMLLMLTSCSAQTQLHPIPLNTVTDQLTEAPEYTHGVYEITIVEKLLYNESVGNEWQKEYVCEGETFNSKKRWTVPLDTVKTVTIDINIIEEDKIPDIGTGSLTVDFTDGYEAVADIIVTELKIAPCKNTAHWQFTCKVKLVDKIVLQS